MPTLRELYESIKEDIKHWCSHIFFIFLFFLHITMAKRYVFYVFNFVLLVHMFINAYICIHTVVECFFLCGEVIHCIFKLIFKINL